MSVAAGLDLRRVQSLLGAGDTRAALTELAALESSGLRDPLALGQIAETYTHCGRHEDAHRCLTRAHAYAPADPRILSNLAASEIALGLLDSAETHLDQAIAREPTDFDAWYNRATLRRQTRDRNHVAQLESAIAKHAPRGDAALGYALSKELEDLGEYARAFDYLERGARARRAQLSYRVEMDLDAIDAIIASFDAATTALTRAPAHHGAGAIFIIGLPRSGTTLVDRILSSHPKVESLGELNDLPLAVMRAAGKAPDRRALIAQASQCDAPALGTDYLARIDGYGRRKPHFIDKTPLNFLYLGLIVRALPAARVIHLRREPLDSCYAMYKTLFRMGYPFSYDQMDLGRYYGAYARLMDHWRTLHAGAFLDLGYEGLVGAQEASTRRLLEHCGLEFHPDCLDFQHNATPSSTASAAQVREPMHARSVKASRREGVRLDRLRETLRAEGVLVE